MCCRRVKVRSRVGTLIYRHPTFVIGATLLLIMLFIAVFAPILGTVDPTALAPAKRTRAPSALYWFGTDMLGRDVYSRTLYGTRVSLIVGFGVAILASVIGVFIGVVAGFVRWARHRHHAHHGWADVDPVASCWRSR